MEDLDRIQLESYELHDIRLLTLPQLVEYTHLVCLRLEDILDAIKAVSL